MSIDIVKVLEGLCEASDDVVYSELRGCGDDEKNSQTKFDLEWDKSVKEFQDMADEIAELREALRCIVMNSKENIATSSNTKSVRDGFEVGGCVKSYTASTSSIYKAKELLSK